MIASGRIGELSDGVCDVQLDVPECCFDGGDCSTCPSCSFSTRQEKLLLKIQYTCRAIIALDYKPLLNTNHTLQISIGWLSIISTVITLALKGILPIHIIPIGKIL